MDMNAVRNVLLNDPEIANWEELRDRWIDATEKPRPDWELPVIVATAVSDEEVPEEVAAMLMAAVGCCQISIILVDDMLDNEPGGVHETLGYGETANMALALQAIAYTLINNLNIANYQKCQMLWLLSSLEFATAVGQHADVQETEWTEERYWQVVKMKSTPFYAGIMALGAAMVFELGEDALINTFFEIGELMGEMVQIRDDLMDIMAKPGAPDWAHGGNLLMIYGRLAEDPSAFETAVSQIAQGDCADDVLEQGQQWLIDEGAVNYCIYLLEQKRELAISVLNSMAIKNHQLVHDVLDELVIQVAALIN